jgi:hypothetical protein
MLQELEKSNLEDERTILEALEDNKEQKKVEN